MFNWLKRLFGSRRNSSLSPSPSAIDRAASFIRQWSDQKICDVLAFCEDGKMDFHNPCCCLLGVHSSSVLHVDCGMDRADMRHHYWVARNNMAAVFAPCAVEIAYAALGISAGFLIGSHEGQLARDRQLIKILRAELERREELRELRWVLSGSRPDGVLTA